MEPVGLQPISNRTRRADTTDAIRRHLLRGSLKPGAPLKDADVARALGVSRATVREAIRPLVDQGILTYEPYRGVRVAEFPAEALNDLNEARVALESTAAARLARAAERVPPSLREALLAMQSARDAEDPFELVNAHYAFHRALCETAGNQVIAQLWLSVEAKTRLVLIQHQLVRPDLAWTTSRHELLLQAIEGGDTQHISRTIEDHILRPPAEPIDLVSAEAVVPSRNESPDHHKRRNAQSPRRSKHG